jgi:hypothetical protein
MRVPYDLQKYFLQINPPSQRTEADGVLLGHLLVDAMEAAANSERASAIAMFVMCTAMLRECELASFDAMLRAIFVGHAGLFTAVREGRLGPRKFRSIFAQEVATADPTALSAAEAATIGHSFASVLYTSVTHSDAIDELILKHPVLGVMAEHHAWFRQMLETIAKRQMARAPLGLRLRLAIGAGLSIADMISDILSTVGMMQSGQHLGAYVLIGLIGAHLAMQLLMAILQNKHRGRNDVAWEVLIVLSLFKPGVDAIRVASGAEPMAGARITPFAEMIVGKVLELAVEAGPGAALQAAVILGGHWNAVAVVSVGISCFTIGFTTAMMAFDLDTNPEKRKHSGNFYGYIPDTVGQRLLLFLELFTLHTAHAMLRTLTVATLARTNWHWLVAYVAADLCGFILYKLARADLI